MKTFNPSPEQSAIFAHVASPSPSNLLINAVAGSGKTTTIIEALKRIPGYDPGALVPKHIVFLAFNAAIAEELRGRLPSIVTCATYHALCRRALDQYAKCRPRLVKDKCFDILTSGIPHTRADQRSILQLVSLLKNTTLVRPSESDVYDLIEHHGLELKNPATAVSAALEVLAASDTDVDIIDFDDMLRFILLHNIPFPRMDYIFVDEWQDSNSLQLELLKRMSSASTRIVAVGDRHQAIYGFRGADIDIFGAYMKAFNAVELPLAHSYRCSRNVCDAANHVLGLSDYIKPVRDFNGTVVHHNGVPTFNVGDVILCRNYAPLIRLSFHLFKQELPHCVTGRNVGRMLCGIIDRTGASSFLTFDTALLSWYNNATSTLRSQRRSTEFYDNVRDSLMAVWEGLPRTSKIDDMKSYITRLFQTKPEPHSIVLSSIHGAKGLEWDDIYILDPHLMPSKFAQQPWQIQQEKNLHYVAITRARDRVTYIQSDNIFPKSNV